MKKNAAQMRPTSIAAVKSINTVSKKETRNTVISDFWPLKSILIVLKPAIFHETDTNIAASAHSGM